MLSASLNKTFPYFLPSFFLVLYTPFIILLRTVLLLIFVALAYFILILYYSTYVNSSKIVMHNKMNWSFTNNNYIIAIYNPEILMILLLNVCAMYLPAQSSSLQLSWVVEVSLPEQGLPPLDGAGLLQSLVLVLVLVPWPHVTEHEPSVSFPQDPHDPSTTGWPES